MIFVTLGTQKFQMNRLVKAVDELAESGRVGEDFFIQSGVSTYKAKHCECKDFMDSSKYVENINNCSVLVTHAGVGTIVTALKLGKPVVVVPRLAKFNEHVDVSLSFILGMLPGKESTSEVDTDHSTVRVLIIK